MKPTTHGGRRRGAGRKSAYPGKADVGTAMLFTEVGRHVLDTATGKSGLSRNDIIDHLLRAHPRAAVPAGGDPYPDKVREPLSIRLTRRSVAILRDLQTKSGQSRGVIGEFLVRTYAPTTKWPTRRRRPRRHRATP